MRRTRQKEAGFALIESIAVLALSSLVILTLLIAGDLVTRGSGMTARRVNQAEVLMTGLAALRRDIDGAEYARGAGEKAPILFRGEPQALGLATAARGYGESLVWIRVQHDDDRNSLVRSTAPLLPTTEDFAGAAFTNAVVLLSGPWNYRFSYGRAEKGVVAWSTSWSDPTKPPDAVSLEVLDGSGTGAVVPPLVATLKVNAEIVCTPSEESSCADASTADQQPEDQNQPQGEATDGSTAGQ